MSLIVEAYNDVLKFLPANDYGRLQTKALAVIESIEDIIKSDLDPSINSLLENKSVLQRVEKDNTFRTVKVSLKVTNLESFLTKLKLYTEDVMDNLDRLETLTKNTLSNRLNHKTITYRQYMLYNLLTDIYSNLEFSLRLIYIIIRDEKESVIPQKQIRDVLIRVPAYASKVLSNVKIKSLIDDILELNNDVIHDRASLDAPDTIKDKDIDPRINNFIGNPIFAIRKWLVNRDMETLKTSKELKSALELRLMELRNEEAGATDEETKKRLQKQIAWHEDKLAAIDAKINKIESKAN